MRPYIIPQPLPLGTHITSATPSLPRQSHCTPFNHPPYQPLVPSPLSTRMISFQSHWMDTPSRQLPWRLHQPPTQAAYIPHIKTPVISTASLSQTVPLHLLMTPAVQHPVCGLHHHPRRLSNPLSHHRHITPR